MTDTTLIRLVSAVLGACVGGFAGAFGAVVLLMVAAAIMAAYEAVGADVYVLSFAAVMGLVGLTLGFTAKMKD